MNKKKIDVLLAVFNGEKFIRQQIESILNQTYNNIHLYIRDNCSEDGTEKIIREIMVSHPTQITYLKSPTNIGIVGNFSALFELTQSGYIMFSDADDVWLPEKIAKTLKRMEKLEDLYGKNKPLLVHTNLCVVNKDLKTIHPSFWKYSFLKPKLPHSLGRQLIMNQITGCTLMINRPLLKIAQPIPSEAIMHDWWLGICAAAFGKSGIVDESTILYRQHGKNDTGAKKHGFLPFLKRCLNPKAREKALKIKAMTYRQADFFLNRYKSELNIKQIELIEGFIQLREASFFKKGYLMYKFDIYSVGFFRNLLLLISHLFTTKKKTIDNS